MRLIDVDALVDDLEHDVRLDSALLNEPDLVGFHRELTQFDKDCKANTIQFLNDAPTVDAVPVIRCSECKFVGTDATCCLVCKREGMGLRPFHVYHDDYCSYAERKEE